MGGDGGLARGGFEGRESGARGIACERAPRAVLTAETHVTAVEPGTDPRVRVGVPQRWKAPRVVESVSSSRRDEGSGLGKPGGTHHAKARSGTPGSD
jgi:hypothetical protein